jgi:hypothetical protein
MHNKSFEKRAQICLFSNLRFEARASQLNRSVSLITHANDKKILLDLL